MTEHSFYIVVEHLSENYGDEDVLTGEKQVRVYKQLQEDCSIAFIDSLTLPNEKNSEKEVKSLLRRLGFDLEECFVGIL